MAQSAFMVHLDKENETATHSSKKSFDKSGSRIPKLNPLSSGKLSFGVGNKSLTGGAHPTPRKALGDVKNVVGSTADLHTSAVPSKIPTPTKPKHTVQRKESPEEPDYENDPEWQIDTCDYKDPVDTFEDILGPMAERLSSLPISGLNRMLGPTSAELFSTVFAAKNHQRSRLNNDSMGDGDLGCYSFDDDLKGLTDDESEDTTTQ